MMARSVRRRLLAVAGCLTMVAMLGLLPGLARVAQAAPPDSSVTLKKTVSRAHLNADGTESIVDTRTVSVSVNQTRDLRGEQQVDVSWSGAHPTGGLQADPNSTDGRLQEYPMVLMECRGIDSPSAPPNQRLDPTTCWTQTPEQR